MFYQVWINSRQLRMILWFFNESFLNKNHKWYKKDKLNQKLKRKGNVNEILYKYALILNVRSEICRPVFAKLCFSRMLFCFLKVFMQLFQILTKMYHNRKLFIHMYMKLNRSNEFQFSFYCLLLQDKLPTLGWTCGRANLSHKISGYIFLISALCWVLQSKTSNAREVNMQKSTNNTLLSGLLFHSGDHVAILTI